MPLKMILVLCQCARIDLYNLEGHFFTNAWLPIDLDNYLLAGLAVGARAVLPSVFNHGRGAVFQLVHYVGGVVLVQHVIWAKPLLASVRRLHPPLPTLHSNELGCWAEVPARQHMNTNTFTQ
jgi:hypothetical protein